MLCNLLFSVALVVVLFEIPTLGESSSNIVVFSSGDPSDPTPCYRIPSILSIPHTAIVLAFAECRTWRGDGCFIHNQSNSSGSQYFNRTICRRRSTDGGLTWGALPTKVMDKMFAANPSAVWHAAHKTVTLIYDNTQDSNIYTSTSHDLGLTFTDPVPVQYHNTSQIQGYAGPGNSIVVLPNGDMAFAAYWHVRNYTTESPTFWSNVYILKEGNIFWQQDGPTFYHIGEPSLTLSTSGVLILDSRCPDGRHPYGGPSFPCDCNCRGTAVRSVDGVWSDMFFDATIPDPDVAGAVFGLSDGRIAFSNPSSTTYRENMTLRIGNLDASQASGITWEDSIVLAKSATEAAGYSSIFQGSDGKVGVLWETHGDDSFPNCYGGYCQIVLTLVTPPASEAAANRIITGAADNNGKK